MHWFLLLVPVAVVLLPSHRRSRRERAGPARGWSVPLAPLELASRSSRRVPPGDLVDRTGLLGAPATMSRFGLSRLGLVVVSLVALAVVLLFIAPHLAS